MQNLIKQALKLAEQGRYSEAFDVLQPIATNSNPSVCLYSADLLHKKDKQKTYQYLLAKWNEGIKGSLHRLVLLKYFFDPNEAFSQDDIELLEKESISGSIESTLVLYSIYEKDERRNKFYQRIKEVSQELIDPLGLSVSYEKRRVPDDDIIKSLNETHSTALPTVLNDTINLTMYKNVFSPLYCHYIKIRTEGLLSPAMIVDPISGKGQKHPVRNNDFTQISPELLDWFFLNVERTIEQISGSPAYHGEPLAILRYRRAQEYKPHYDALSESNLTSGTEVANGGQRMKTIICGLSEGFEGGETSFPKLNITVKLLSGDVMSFDNVDEHNNILKSSYHAGLPVSSGDKWVMTKWLRKSTTKYGKMVYL